MFLLSLSWLIIGLLARLTGRVAPLGWGLGVVHFVHVHVFTICFPLSGVCSGIRVIPMFISYLFPFVLQELHVLFEIFIVINVY